MTRSLLSLALVFACTGFVMADNWPQWRGPSGDGISKEKGFATEWSKDKNILWSFPLPGMGCSTPIIWGDKIFLTCEDKSDLILQCISTSGKPLWQEKIGPATKKARDDEGNGATATLSTDGKNVYGFVGSGTVFSYTLDGKKNWDFDAQQRYGKFNIQFGMHSTPVLHENRLYFMFLSTGKQIVACVEAKDGSEVWRVNRKSDGTDENEHSYASPVMWTNGKQSYLVTHGNDYTVAHDLKDGSEIWRLQDLNPRLPLKDGKSPYNKFLRFVATPLVTPDLIVVPTAKNGPIVAVKPDAKGTFGIGSEHELWRKPNGTPDVPSPLLWDGVVYIVRENGALMGLDAKTGKELWNDRGHTARHRASPVYADGKIYATSRDGVVNVIKAGRTFEKLATNRLPDDFAASPALADGVIYLRGFKNLWAIKETK